MEIVEDGINGFVVPSDPQTIAEAMDKLYYSKESAKKMGQAGHEKLISMNISWDNVVKKLIG